jgi:hypothetical protein
MEKLGGYTKPEANSYFIHISKMKRANPKKWICPLKDDIASISII